MSTVSNQLGQIQISLTQVQAGIQALDQAIQNFESNQTSELNPTDQAALTALVSQSAALAQAASTIPMVPVTSAPTPTPTPST